jgi:hypothetical protein
MKVFWFSIRFRHTFATESMTLHDFFERIVILNLPYKQDRRRRLTANLRDTGIADPKKVKWQRATAGDWTGHPAWWNAGNGAWGCAWSHVSALETAIMDKLESVLILEDDAIFAADAQERLADLSPEWPHQWGQIYLGGQHLGEAPAAVSDQWLMAHNVNRTHAYGVHRNTMARMMAHCLYAPDYMAHPHGWHIDHQLGIAHERKDWAVYAPKWWLAGQAADRSNISGKANREMWWQRLPEKAAAPLVILPEHLKSSDPAYQDYCHAGNNLYNDTCRDLGADKALRMPGGLHRFLSIIRAEALEHRRLPAVQHPGYDSPAVKKAWSALGGRVVKLSDAGDLADLSASTIATLHRAVIR